MIYLADMEYKSLQAGMKFRHSEYGEQIIIDLSIGQFGPIIRFHHCKTYSGELPNFGEEEGELDIFQTMASQIYPFGADQWEYLGIASASEIEDHGWEWWQVVCPHCGFVHHLLSSAPNESRRNCRECGMTFNRVSQKIHAP
jgi:hypothetical protein